MSEVKFFKVSEY